MKPRRSGVEFMRALTRMNDHGAAAWGVECGAWVVASASRTGTHHPHCEDAALAHFPLSGGLHVCVADGVSNGEVGHVAAQRLVRHCVGLPEIEAKDGEAVARWVEAADAVVAEAVIDCGHRRGAACMASAWLDVLGEGYLSHVGDCRIYRWSLSNDAVVRVKALTRDQSYFELGEMAPSGVDVHNPARMIGSGSVGVAQVQRHNLGPRSGLLMCSDGVHDVMDATDLGSLMKHELQGNCHPSHEALEKISQTIVRECLTRGSRDDICVAIIWRQDSES